MHDKALDPHDFQTEEEHWSCAGLSFPQKQGHLPVLSVLMKAAFIKNAIKLHGAQLSNTINIPLRSASRGPAQAAGLVPRACHDSLTSDLSFLDRG